MAEAEAPFALSTMDYCFRGTGHIHGGIGALAWAMVEAIKGLGGSVMLSSRVRASDRRPTVPPFSSQLCKFTTVVCS